MSILTSVLSKLSKLALFLLIIAVLPGLPPHGEFEAISLTPTLPLEGSLAINSRLNNAERLFEGKIRGPEGLEVHKGQLYTTVHGGHVVKIVGDTIEPVVKFGQSCDGEFHEEEKCGRPLGLTFDKKGNMYVADAYYGIFKVDLSTGKVVNLVSTNDTIDGKRPMVPNSVAVDSENYVYWTDSSTTHKLHDGVFTTLINGNGRLLKYNPTTKSNTILLDKLHFANGVALSNDESFLVVAESMAHRIQKYHLKGPQAGKSEVFLDGLPGVPDNMHSIRDGFVVTLIYPENYDNPRLSTILAPYPLIRKLLARLLHLGQRAVIFLRDLYPVDILKKAAHWIGHFESVRSPSVKRTSVLFLTKEGKVSRSLHSTDDLIGISDFIEYGGYYYLGSPFNHFLARVKAT